LEQDHKDVVRKEFERAASIFAERTKGRFDRLDPVGFSRLEPGGSVMEVGGGTGNFLALFGDVAGLLLAVDLTHGMLAEASQRNPGMLAVVADGAKIPAGDESVDLVASAQMFHHVWDPVEIIREMGRVSRGRILVVDQVSNEDTAQAAAMTELELVRDPSHALTRRPSELRDLLTEAGLQVIDERMVESRDRFSKWMWKGEFPEERIEEVRRFILDKGSETGMDFAPVDEDFEFTRRRLMLLAEALK
jgi:ubiquinone/menaquinone biosynthesis C-methylase UbiE